MTDTFKTFCNTFKGKRVTLMGLGVLGRGTGDAKFLAECGAELTVTDLKSEQELASSVEALRGLNNVRFVLGEHRKEDFTQADIVIKGNAVPLDNEYIKAAQDSDVRVAMSVALAAQYAKSLGMTLVGVTGTRGKSTVVQMIYEAAQAHFAGERQVHLGGNVRGVSTLALTPEFRAGDILVLELDSWILQGFGYERLSPQVAVFTNFYPDHLNYYHNMDEYFADKANIFKYQDYSQGDTLIVGDDAWERVQEAHPPVEPLDAGPIPAEWELKVPGVHNRANAALAREALHGLGMTDVEIKVALENFAGVEGRLEYIGEFDGVKIYNDNNATTPEATTVAIRALAQSNGVTAGKLILVAGGADKGLELSEVTQLIRENVSCVFLLNGSGTERLASLLDDVEVFETLTDAVRAALRAARKGDTVLFSPMFASFSKEFRNEYERNDVFKRLVREYFKQ